MKESVILLTACINPNGMAYTALQDKDVRLRQYKEALDWYLLHVQNKIVFVENTGYDISPMYEEAIAIGRLEVLTFQGNDFDKSRGKGYGEALIIKHALDNSKFLKENVIIIKVTGRLICENVSKIARKCADVDTIYGLRLKDDTGAFEIGSQVIVAPVRFWNNYFIPEKERIDDKSHYWFEHYLYDTICQWQDKGHKFREMSFPVLLKGISGSSGVKINTTSLKSKVSFYVHYILNLFGYYGPIRFL